MPFDNPSPKSVCVEILEETRDLLFNGWMQNEYEDGYGNFCMVGALQAAQALRPALEYADQERCYECISYAIEQTTLWNQRPSVDSRQDIMNFNDAACRTHADVLEVMEKAILVAQGD